MGTAMLKWILAALLAFGACSPVFAQSTAAPVIPGWLQSGICGPGQTTCWVPATPLSQFQALTFTFATVGSPGTLSASTTTSNLALPANGAIVEIANGGSVAVYVNLGIGSSLAATTHNMLVGPGQTIFLPVGSATYIAGITASSTASVTVTVGNPAAGGGGSGGNVTITGPLGRQADALSVSSALSTEDVALQKTSGTPCASSTTVGCTTPDVGAATLAAVQGAIPAGTNTIGNVNVVANNAATGIIEATASVPISFTAAGGPTQIIAASGATKIYITHIHYVLSGAGTFALVTGTGTNCGTGTAYLEGASGHPLSYAANGGISAGGGLGPIYVTGLAEKSARSPPAQWIRRASSPTRSSSPVNRLAALLCAFLTVVWAQAATAQSLLLMGVGGAHGAAASLTKTFLGNNVSSGTSCAVTTLADAPVGGEVVLYAGQVSTTGAFTGE